MVAELSGGGGGGDFRGKGGKQGKRYTGCLKSLHLYLMGSLHLKSTPSQKINKEIKLVYLFL